MPTDVSYAETIAALESLGIMPTTLPSLAPMERAMALLPLKIPAAKNIIIAGTNGKGTTASTLSALLRSAGRSVGLYTSPHLVSACERFRINEEDITEKQFTAAYKAVKHIIAEAGLTHFEALTLMAAHLFFSGECVPPVDYAIWEVGMGGRFDATNAIPHHHCAITALAMDHQNILGDTLRAVAWQKFGVIGAHAPVAYSPMVPELAPLRDEVAANTGCRWVPAPVVRMDSTSRITTPWGVATLALRGHRAAENTATALTVFSALGFDPSVHLDALAKVRWPGRFSALTPSPLPCPLYLSGDHNCQGIESLLRILDTMTWDTLHLIVGIGRDKDAGPMLEKLFSVPRAKVYLTETPFKPFRTGEYPPWAREQSCFLGDDVFDAMAAAGSRAAPGDLAVVTGSLYLVGKVLAAHKAA